MNQIYSLSKDEMLKARQFHLQHFPAQDVPMISNNESNNSASVTEPPAQPSFDDLGLYPDGTRRTLTDEQIALFRHSEIQRLLAERRHQNEAQEDKRRKVAGRHHTSRKQNPLEASVPTRYQDDTMVHAKDNVDELIYGESNGNIEDKQPKQFQWPVLGA